MSDNSNKKRSSPTPDDLAEIRRKRHKQYLKKREEEKKKREQEEKEKRYAAATKAMKEQQQKFSSMMMDSSSDEESDDDDDVKKKKSETWDDCQICKAKIKEDDKTLTCHKGSQHPHTFHEECLDAELKKNNNNNNECPSCRGICLPDEEYIEKYPLIRPPDPAGVAQLIDNLIEPTYLLLNTRMVDDYLQQWEHTQPHAHANGWKWDIFVCDSYHSENNSEGYLPYGWKEVKETRNHETRYRYQDPNGSFTDEDGNEYTNPRETGCGMYEPTEGVAFNRQDNDGFIPLPPPFKHSNPDADNDCRYCNNQDSNHSIGDHHPRWREQEDAINQGKYFQWFLTNKWRAHNRNHNDRHPNYGQAGGDMWHPMIFNEQINFICPKCYQHEENNVSGCSQAITLEKRDDDGNVVDHDYMRWCPGRLHKDVDGEHQEYCGYHELTPHRLIFREGLNNTPKIKTTDMYFDTRGFLQIGEEIEENQDNYGDVWNEQREIYNEKQAENDDGFDEESEDYMKKMVYVLFCVFWIFYVYLLFYDVLIFSFFYASFSFVCGVFYHLPHNHYLNHLNDNLHKLYH